MFAYFSSKLKSKIDIETGVFSEVIKQAQFFMMNS